MSLDIDHNRAIRFALRVIKAAKYPDGIRLASAYLDLASRLQDEEQRNARICSGLASLLARVDSALSQEPDLAACQEEQSL